MRILLTGGVGCIGGHASFALAVREHEIVCFDNSSNSWYGVMDRLAAIAGQTIPLVVGGVRDTTSIQQVIGDYGIEGVIHFAGLKAVGYSVRTPLTYYDNDIVGTLSFFSVMEACAVRKLLFSSSGTVYCEPQCLPFDESHFTPASSPYGRSKPMIEEVLRDVALADARWRIGILRYFNLAWAHESDLIGEDPSGIPNNLMPYIGRVASGRLDQLTVFSTGYDTIDGIGVRDYIHAVDLAHGHEAALNVLESVDEPLSIWNLRAGRGYSFLEMIAAFERANEVSIPYVIAHRRPGDVASCYASVTKAKAEMGWMATRELEDMFVVSEAA